MAMKILFLRGNTAQNDAYTGQLGEITIDTQARRVRLHNGVTAGGFAELANMDDLGALQTQINNLGIGDISGLQAALNALDGRIEDLEDEAILRDGSVAFTGDQSMGGNKITNLGTPTADGDAATKLYVDDSIAVLGNAFNYVGVLEGGVDEPNAFDLDSLPADGKDPGDYYKVTTAGWFEYNAVTKFLNVGDGLVFNTANGFDKIDNTNSEVQGTADRILVTGSPDTGFVVDIDPTFVGRVEDLEAGGGVTGDLIDDIVTAAGLAFDGSSNTITYEPDTNADYIDGATSLFNADQLLDSALANLAVQVGQITAGSVVSVSGTLPIVVDNTDPQNPVISINAATTSAAGSMSAADKTKLDGIEAGAQVNVDTDLAYVPAASSGEVTSSTGTNATIPAATTTEAGLLTAADKTKLDGIEAGAQVNVGTDLAVGGSGDARTITSSTGNDANVPVATTTDAGFMSIGDKNKLDGIETGAQVNTVTSVNGETGVVVLDKTHIGLSNVENYEIATQAEVEDQDPTTVNNKYMTPLRTRQLIEGGAYTIDLGTL